MKHTDPMIWWGGADFIGDRSMVEVSCGCGWTTGWVYLRTAAASLVWALHVADDLTSSSHVV